MIVETIKRTYKKTRFVGTKLPHGIVLHEESILTQVEKTPELDLWGQNSPHDIVLHEENHTGRENPRTPSHPYTAAPWLL